MPRVKLNNKAYSTTTPPVLPSPAMPKFKSLDDLEADLSLKKTELRSLKREHRQLVNKKTKMEKLMSKPTTRITRNSRKTKNSRNAKKIDDKPVERPKKSQIKKMNDEINKKHSEVVHCMAEIKSIEAKIQQRKSAQRRRKLEKPIDYDIFQKSTKPDLQPEIFYDMIKFLTRDEIEKSCQLVSRWWNDLILDASGILPLRKLYSLTYDVNRYLTNNDNETYRAHWRYRESSGCYGTPLRINQKNLGLKNAVLTKFMAYANEMDEKFFKKLEDIEKISGMKKFVAKEVVITLFSETLEETEKNYEKMIKFLENHIFFGELILKLGDNSLPHLVQYKQFLPQLQRFPVITLISTSTRRDYSNAEILEFIESSPLPDNQLSVELTGNNCPDDFGCRFVEAFLKHLNPAQMIRHVVAESWSFHHLRTQTIDYLTGPTSRIKATIIKEPNQFYEVEIYEIKRKDGWILKVDPHKRCREPTYLRCIEFKVYKK